MLYGGRALLDVSTDDLKELLRQVHSGALECPVTRIGLASTGLLRLGDDLGHLTGLNAGGVHAVLVAVLAERAHR